MFMQTWALMKEKAKKNLGLKERENEINMENGCSLTSKTIDAVLDFSMRKILWDRNMPILTENIKMTENTDVN